MEVSKALQRNSKANLINTLRNFASAQRQLDYEEEVPFVDVPRELIAQWEQHASLLASTTWFPTLFNEVSRRKLKEFGEKLEAILAEVDLDMDLRLLVLDPQWNALAPLAGECIAAICDSGQ